jgi:hypothetical protein
VIHPVQRLLALVCLGFPCLVGADTPQPANPITPQAPAAIDPSKLLLDALPQVAEIVSRDGKVQWTANGQSATITSIDATSNDPLIETTLGNLRVSRRLLQDHHTDVLAALPGLIAIATDAHLDVKDLKLEEGVLTGPSLRSDSSLVITQGLLTKQPITAPDRSSDLAAVTAMITELVAATHTTALNDIDRKALEAVLHKLDQPDGNQAPDDIAPSFARRVVKHGWLEQWFHTPQGAAMVASMEKAVKSVEQDSPISSFIGTHLSMQQVQDAFGQGGYILSTPKGITYLHQEAHPEYVSSVVPQLMVAIDLPPGSDPLTDSSHAISARIFHGGTQLASWNVVKGFQADPAAWRTAVPSPGGNYPADLIPPHILISSLNGDVTGLAVEKGLLRPVSDGSHGAAEHFLSEAAEMMPDISHLDLIGEYFFSYVYPSPDAKFPTLMGNKQFKSNVQQTVWQTCGNACGGIMHGDCADIAELYQTLTAKQNHNPIVVGLPEHAACAWADKQNDTWHVSILQTGPPLEFTNPVLPDCLGEAYKSFDPGMAFDANQVPLLLRFSGEVSRSEWVLSWRIFSEPNYAKTMFDVERDWQYETYQRGIQQMKKLISQGDDDNANYRELSGLYDFTGQYDLAAEYHRKALDRTKDEVSRMYMTIQLVEFLLNGGKMKEAAQATSEVMDQQLPKLKEQIGGATYLQVGLNIAGSCLNTEGGPSMPDQALKTFNTILEPTISGYIDKIATFITGPQFDQNSWDNAPQIKTLRNIIGGYTGLVIELMHRQGAAKTGSDPAYKGLRDSVQHWLDGIAFHDVEEATEVMDKYAAAGRFYEAIQGVDAIDKQLDLSQPATEAAKDHTKRVGGAAQVALDLPWIRASIPYWYGRLSELFRRDQKQVDTAVVVRLGERLAEAHAAAAAMGLTNPRYEQQAVLGAEIVALVTHNDQNLRTTLHHVADLNDKNLRDDCAQWIGDTARFIDVAYFPAVLKAWQDELDYKPKYFWIAWRAALNNAPSQALMTAKLAASRFHDDPAFTEEYGFMQQVLKPKAEAADAPANAAP